MGRASVKIPELRALCTDAIKRFEAGEVFGDKPFILLVIPTQKVPRGDNMRLCGRHGPLGYILSCRYTKSQLQEHETLGLYYNNVSFDARKVLEFIRSAPE